MVNVQLMRPFTAFMHVCIERIDKLDFSHFEANADKHMSHIVQSQDAPAHNETQKPYKPTLDDENECTTTTAILGGCP